MQPYYENKLGTLYQGDCKDVLSFHENNSVDAVVTDPPYGYKFMGKKWDYDVPSVEAWKEILRVLKPGGHLLSFGGPRTYHRLAVAVEDAGFEIRDQIMWLYGSGFPKSQDVGKEIDKKLGNERQIVELKETVPNIKANNYSNSQGKERLSATKTIGNSEWEGWGTSIKPAHEPLCLARKPLQGTVASNVMEWGTGAVNVDGCRVGTTGGRNNGRNKDSDIYGDFGACKKIDYDKGRFPANVIHDGSEEVVREFPEQQSGAMKKHYEYTNNSACYGKPAGNTRQLHEANAGSAARFFKCCTFDDEDLESFSRVYYCAKASPSERGKYNTWPTVKPKSLIRYLINMITPPGGVVLDPYLGSGTTIRVCQELGIKWLAVEKEKEAIDIALKRIKEPRQMSLMEMCEI